VEAGRRKEHLETLSSFRRGAILKAMKEGDYVKAERLSTGVSRSQEELDNVSGAFRQLTELSKQQPQ
jgi:hypothetical protein